MYDRERVGMIIRDINDYFVRLNDVKVKAVGDLDEDDEYYFYELKKNN